CRGSETAVRPPLSGLPASKDGVASSPAVALCRVRGSRALRTVRDQRVANTRSHMTAPACPFCNPPDDRLFHRGRLVLGLWDQFPVSPGHALIIPRRHVASWFEATDEERAELMAVVADARAAIEGVHQPDGYNLGVNIGPAAGQTVFHLHVHVIPRYHGDVPAPRGGVRHVIPEKADYAGMVREAAAESYAVLSPTTPGGLSSPATVRPPHWQALVHGGDDPLLPHLRAHLATAVRVDIAVAFVLERGLVAIDEHLKDVVRRGG